MSMFSDLAEEVMGIFMDDFTVYGSSFENCLNNQENSASKMQGQTASIKLGKVPFHGNKRHCSWL